MTNVYRCTFEYNGQVHTVESIRGIAAFAEGFWLDRDLKLLGEPGQSLAWVSHVWIPPGRVYFVERRQLVASDAKVDLVAKRTPDNHAQLRLGFP